MPFDFCRVDGGGCSSPERPLCYEYALEEGYSCQATCPYASTWLERRK